MTDRIILRPSADVLPLLAGMIDALGTAAAASLPGADRAQVSQWTAGTEPVSAEMGRRIVDLHAVLAMEGAYTQISVPPSTECSPSPRMSRRIIRAAPSTFPSKAGGRLDDPELQAILCLSDAASGAIAEALGRFPECAMLAGNPSPPGSVRAIVEIPALGR